MLLLLQLLTAHLAVLAHCAVLGVAGAAAEELVGGQPLLVVRQTFLLEEKSQFLDDVVGPLLVFTELSVHVGRQP